MRILKFGGKSLATPEKVQNICKYIKKIYKNDKEIIIIVSAMGKNTDSLIMESKDYCLANQPVTRELDVLLSTGETKSSALFAMALNSVDVPAKSFQAFQLQISTFGDFQNSKVAYINKTPLEKCLSQGIVAVVSGFQGINKNNEITTLGRGGSDTTACAIGAVFNHNVEIYSDFNGVFCGDPRTSKYKKINKINHSHMLTLSKSGAKVLDARAVLISKKFNLDIFCKSSSSPLLSGTLVSSIEDKFVSISTKDDLCEISIVFSDISKINFIIKNVLNEIKNVKFYNLTLENDKISFLINKKYKHEILINLSKKFNLLAK